MLAVLRGLCWFDFEALSGNVDVNAAAVDVVSAEAAIFRFFFTLFSQKLDSSSFETFFFSVSFFFYKYKVFLFQQLHNYNKRVLLITSEV